MIITHLDHIVGLPCFHRGYPWFYIGPLQTNLITTLKNSPSIPSLVFVLAKFLKGEHT